MSHLPTRLDFALVAATTLLVGGCASYTTLQSPRTLRPGKVQLGAGTAIVATGSEPALIPEFGGRVGVARHFDVGAKYMMPGLLFGDAKLQLLDARHEAPFDLALDLGVSHTSFDSEDDDGSLSCTGLYPALLIGKDFWYAGAKATYLFIDGKGDFGDVGVTFDASGLAYTTFVAGLVLGQTLQFLPEVNLHVNSEGEPLLMPAISLVYNMQ